MSAVEPNPQRHNRRLTATVALLSSIVACTQISSDRPVVLVTVDDRPITSKDLAVFQQKLPDHLQPRSTDAAAVTDLLWALVDQELMMIEAEALGYPDEPAVSQQLHHLLVESVSRRVVDREIGRLAAISDREIEQAYFEEGWNRMVWPAHIVTDSRDAAKEVLLSLRAGADFAELANEYSSALDAIRGGDMMRFFGPGDGRPELIEATRALSDGEFSDAVVTDDGVEVFRVLATRQVPLKQVRARLTSELRRRGFESKYIGYISSLERRFDVKYGSGAIERIVDSHRLGIPLSPDSKNLPMVTYRSRDRGKKINLGAFHQLLSSRGFGMGSLADSADVVDAGRRWVMADSLFLLAAEADGLLEEEGFKNEVRRRYRRMLTNLLRRRQVLEKAKIERGDQPLASGTRRPTWTACGRNTTTASSGTARRSPRLDHDERI